MIAEILAIGNEVVDGSVVNTNASWLAGELSALGLEVRFHTAVPDTPQWMKEAFITAASRAELVLVTGGLGPTLDDITLKVAAEFFSKPLIRDEISLKNIRHYFEKLGRVMTQNQENQALIPEGAHVLTNKIGTAPGVYYVYDSAEHLTHFAFFPGVPAEMKKMFQESFLSLFQPQLTSIPLQKRFLKTLHCFGLPEGQMDYRLRHEIQAKLENLGINLGFRVRFPTTDVRLSLIHPDEKEAEKILQQGRALVEEKLGEAIFGEGEIKLEEVVAQLFIQNHKTVSVAESCTGGLLAHLITDIPGASEFFLGGLVTYSNQAKIDFLGVSKKTLDQYGAVSSQVALEMAQGLQRRFSSDFAIAITGIAGPSGGSEDKPVGTVHIAILYGDLSWEKRFQFPVRRDLFKQVVVHTALDRVRGMLESS